MGNTQVGISFCKGERYLQNACSTSSIFALDIIFARNLMAQDTVSIESAIERVEHGGPISPVQKSELQVCLGRIAAGQCPYHEKLAL